MRDECNWTPTHLSFVDPMTVCVKVKYSFGNPARRECKEVGTRKCIRALAVVPAVNPIARLGVFLASYLSIFLFFNSARARAADYIDAPNAPSRASTCRTARRGHRAQARRISLVSGGALQRPLLRRAHVTSVVQ